MCALIALRGDTGPAGNVVTGGAFCFVGPLDWKAPSGDSRNLRIYVFPCLPSSVESDLLKTIVEIPGWRISERVR